MEVLKSIQSSPLVVRLRSSFQQSEEDSKDEGESSGILAFIKSKKKLSIFNKLSPYSEPAKVKKATLAELAEIYRSQNPQTWKNRQESKRRVHNELIGVYELSPLIAEINQKHEQLTIEMKKEERRRRLLPRVITVDIKFGMPPIQTTRRLSLRRKSDIQLPELSVTVVKGSSLFNHIDENDELSEKCCLKAQLLPDGDKSDKNKSSYRYLTMKGVTRWDHTFKFPGIVQSFADRYVQIRVIGVNRAGDKNLIGTTVVGAKSAAVEMEDYKSRNLVEREYKAYEQALENQETTFTAYLKLYPEDWSGMQGITITQNKPPPPSSRRSSIFQKGENQSASDKEGEEKKEKGEEEKEEKNEEEKKEEEKKEEEKKEEGEEKKEESEAAAKPLEVPEIKEHVVEPNDDEASKPDQEDAAGQEDSLTLPVEYESPIASGESENKKKVAES